MTLTVGTILGQEVEALATLESKIDDLTDKVDAIKVVVDAIKVDVEAP